MSIGMTYEQFWEGNPQMVKYYREAEELKVRRQNQQLWLQGYYVYNAIGAFVEILPAFPKKGAKVQPYLQEPLSLTEAERRQKEEERMKQKMERIKERMMARALEINARKAGVNDERNND